MSTSRNQPLQEEQVSMAILASDGDGIGQQKVEDPEDDSRSIVDVRLKGPGKAIHIRENASLPDQGYTESTNEPVLNRFAPSDKVTPIPNVIVEEQPHSSDFGVNGWNETGKFSSNENIKRLPPRQNSELPLKKRYNSNHSRVPYNRRSSEKTHDGKVERDLRNMRLSMEPNNDDMPGYMKDLKHLLFEDLLLNAIRRRVTVNIAGKPHILTAVPTENAEVGVDDSMSFTHRVPSQDLHGISDRPPPASSVISNVSAVSEMSEVDCFHEYRNKDVSEHIASNDGVGGPPQQVFYSPPTFPVSNGTSNQLPFTPMKTESMYGDYGFPCPDESGDEALDLSFKPQHSTNHADPATNIAADGVPMMGVVSNAWQPHTASNIPGTCTTDVAGQEIDKSTVEQVPMEAVEIAGNVKRASTLDQLTPEAKFRLQLLLLMEKNGILLSTLDQLTPEQVLQLFLLLQKNCHVPMANPQMAKQESAGPGVSVEEPGINNVTETIPQLEDLELTNENGGLRETESEKIKRSLKVKLSSKLKN